MNSRLSKCFFQVCKAGKKTTIQELADLFHVSLRTIYSDIKKLNELLVTANYPYIQVKKGELYYPKKLSIHFEALLKEKKDFVITNPRLRKLRVTEKILTMNDSFSMDDLLEHFDLSRNTLLNDLKEIKAEMLLHDVDLEAKPFTGYKVVGSEQAIRQLMILSMEEDVLFFEQENENRNYQIIEKSELILDYFARKLNRQLSGASFQRLIITFWVTWKRISIGKKIPYQKYRGYLTKEEKAFLDDKKKIEMILNCTVEYEECIYLANKFSEASIISYDQLISENWVDFQLMVNEFIQAVQQQLPKFNFENDNSLYEGLINHLRPAYKRSLSGESQENPLFHYVVENYRQLHSVVDNCVSIFEEKLNVNFSPHERSYFTLFFASSLEKSTSPFKKKPEVILVCNAGISTSEILKSRIEGRYHVNIIGTFSSRNAEKWLENNRVDLVITTVDFISNSIPVLQVTPYLSDEDMKKLIVTLQPLMREIEIEEVLNLVEKQVKLDANQRTNLLTDLETYFGKSSKNRKIKGRYQPMLTEVLKESLIRTNFEAESRDEAVKESGRLLVENGLAKSDYITGMLDNVEENGTYIVIAPGIAMPHARPETGSLDIGLSIVTLKEAVTFGHPKNDPVKIVIGLCAVDHQSHLKALAELVGILSNEETVTQILDAETSKEVLSIIEKGGF